MKCFKYIILAVILFALAVLLGTFLGTEKSRCVRYTPTGYSCCDEETPPQNCFIHDIAEPVY